MASSRVVATSSGVQVVIRYFPEMLDRYYLPERTNPQAYMAQLRRDVSGLLRRGA